MCVCVCMHVCACVCVWRERAEEKTLTIEANGATTTLGLICPQSLKTMQQGECTEELEVCSGAHYIIAHVSRLFFTLLHTLLLSMRS